MCEEYDKIFELSEEARITGDYSELNRLSIRILRKTSKHPAYGANISCRETWRSLNEYVSMTPSPKTVPLPIGIMVV